MLLLLLLLLLFANSLSLKALWRLHISDIQSSQTRTGFSSSFFSLEPVDRKILKKYLKE